ncbi:hypothetical protein J7L01_03050 [bacterium]|nr:hypothetical protein [bacterium]
MGKYDLLLAKLGDDRTNGAELLVVSALEIIRSATEDETLSDEELAQILRSLVGTMRNRFGELSPLAKLAARIESLPTDNLRKSAAEMRRSLQRKIAHESASLAKLGSNLIAQNSTIATISQSKTILDVVLMAKGLSRDFHVIVAISEPAGEGKNAAKSFAESGIPVTLVPDAAIGYAVEKADIVIVGADAVTEKFFLNKIGTLPMALAANHFRVPFYVCARLEKFTPARLLLKSRRSITPADLNIQRSDLITSNAPLFERVPNSLVTGIITESGIVTPENGRIDIAEAEDD